MKIQEASVPNNCAGCKYLDQIQHGIKGEGYCSRIKTLSQYRFGMSARYANMERCELYEEGEFKHKFDVEEISNDKHNS